MGGERKQAVFFDIDGTLWDFHNYIPPSAVEAIHGLQKNGHLAFLCSGRTRAFIRHPDLLGIGFDGIVSGCGTRLEYGGKVLYEYRFDSGTAERIVTVVRRHGFKPILEGTEYLYLERADFENDPYGKKVFQDMGDRLRGITEHWGTWEFSKLSCETHNCDQAAAFAELPELDPIAHNPDVVELVPRGFDKGGGILRLCELIGHDPADTVAFGDSFNDLSMFRACAQSVCMGNGVPAAKAAASYVTTDLHEDGVWNACKHLGLI